MQKHGTVHSIKHDTIIAWSVHLLDYNWRAFRKAFVTSMAECGISAYKMALNNKKNMLSEKGDPSLL